MAIDVADFSRRLSGGATNAVGNASLGGVKSSVVMGDAIDGVFDATSAPEAVAGRVEYRCIYLHNANAADVMTAARAWIAQQPTVGVLAIGVGAAAVNGNEAAIANETTAPAGVVFSAPANAAAGLLLGNLPAGQHRALWLRRTIPAGALNTPDDDWLLGFNCETA